MDIDGQRIMQIPAVVKEVFEVILLLLGEVGVLEDDFVIRCVTGKIPRCERIEKTVDL